jgi:hypothetical protein
VILFVPSLCKSLYKCTSVTSIKKFPLIDDSLLQVIPKLDRSMVINTFQSGNIFILDHILSKSISLDDDTDYVWILLVGFLKSNSRSLRCDNSIGSWEFRLTLITLRSSSHRKVLSMRCSNGSR